MKQDYIDVLEITSTASQANTIPGWEDARVKLYKPGALITKRKFDGIYAPHLTTIFYQDIDRELAKLSDMLKEGGELHVIVPSLEWGCREILTEAPGPHTYPHLWGRDKKYPHLSGYTMRGLRSMVEKAGIDVVYAMTHPYTARVNDENHHGEQHYLKGVKPHVETTKE